ncbi:sterol-sensing domain of SREBP cleavage-activation-domain-containing protein [Dichomitus squalens]|uniref:Sterol regulatory element-binding protein cleavage-activating protein n=1 Tax=Dichomitus squalens TaxID=114155 RepID=A0A4Q9MHG8_9APHY|nr:sterol-sensing domain of SREBP cleavage-activation-domain-containing protein [Dichomitus squalens]
MPSPMSLALLRARLVGTQFFYRFGIHCATHQIRLILVSSVVITSLLFPAIASYYSSQTQYFAGFTLRVLDSFLTPDDISSYFAQHDLRHLWEGDAALRTRADSVARARCGMEGILREERVLVGSVSPEEGLGALDKNTLLATLKLERRISEALSSRSISCLRSRDGSCFALSPSAFWNYDEQALAADDDILDTLNLSQNVTISGLPITPDMVLAGRELHDPSSNHIDAAMFLVLTYFFPEKECFGNDGHFLWLHALEDAGGDAGELVVLAQEPHLIALEYRKNASLRTRFTMLFAFTSITYTAFGVYCFWLFRRMTMVHSRIGLAFTGIVEILVSTITSVSVCALVGFRVTMVPWELFPIIVVFIGVENMYSIVDAVVKTSITLPVKERIAQGLSRAGTSNTLKVVSYNALLGVLAVFSTGAIRQFCAFSIVVLVAHWFLVHTFFVTVVSIDIQRLELDELLRQGSNLTPNVIQDPRKSNPQSSKTKFGSTWSAVRELVRGRPAKNISLFMLLAITAALWYTTTPQAVGHKPTAKPTATRNPLAQLSRVQNMTPDSISPAQRVWQILNPVGDPLIHIRIESPTILVLGDRANTAALDEMTAESDKHSFRPRVSRYWSRTVRPVVWLLKIFVMPITGTTMLLYGLLLYLLKDAELLEAQRHAAEPESPTVDEPPSVEGGISFTTLPRAFATDVDLIAASEDGKTIATVGLENEFVIWRTDRQSHVVIDPSTSVLGSCASTPSASTTLTAVAMNSLGNICAAGTGAGTIAVFLIGKDQIKPLPHLHLEHLSSGITALHFTGSLKYASGAVTPLRPGTPGIDVEAPTELTCHLYASYENGAVVEWDILSTKNPRYVTPSRAASVVKSMLLPIQADGRLLVGFSLDDGMLELCNVERDNSVFKEECAISAGNPADLVTKVHVCNVELDGTKRIIVGAATQAGIISLWDALSRECLIILDEPFGDINVLKLSPVHISTCTTCGELPIENFSITFSVGHVVQFYRAYLTLPTRRCSCPRNLPQQAPRSSLLAHRGRSGSNASVASTGTNTPVRPRSRRSSFSSPPTIFPVSGHGVHSRRASEKDSLRRASETFFLNNPDYFEYDMPLGPQDVIPASSFLASAAQPSIWQSLVVVRVSDTTVERGGWDVGHDDKIVGIRRRPRPPVTRKTGSDPRVQQDRSVGLTAAALDRWELWTFDPAESKLQASPLLALNREPPRKRKYEADTSTGSLRMTAPLPKRRGAVPRLHFTRVSPFLCTPGCCLAGFGNTVGLFRFHHLTVRRGSGSGRGPGSPSKPPKEGRNGSAKAE